MSFPTMASTLESSPVAAPFCIVQARVSQDLYKSVEISSSPEIIRGVRASSIKTESTSSMIA